MLGLSRREAWWKDAEILMLRHQFAVALRERPRAYSRLTWPEGRGWPCLPDDVGRRYEETTNSLHEFRLALEALIQVILEQEGIKFHSVTGRVKSKSSTLRKLRRPDKQRSIGDLTDLLGVRIITYFPDEVDAVATLIEREFLIDTANSVDKRTLLDPDRFGYLSLHYVVQLNEPRVELAEYRSYSDIRFEVQIRSILQHAWYYSPGL